MKHPGLVRLQRVMASAGVASRRECEVLIEEGHVTVNHVVVRKLPILIDPDVDVVHVDGRPLPKPERHFYIMVNKPARVLCTTRDDPAFLDAKGQGRPTILDLVSHPAKPRLYPVGRLDFHTTGLVLLTNDGDLANKLTHPRHGVPRTYEALVRRSASAADLTEISKQSNASEPGKSAVRKRSSSSAVNVSFVKHDADRTLIRVSLTEGPNRNVPDVLARLGFHVKRLQRVAIGPLELSGVPVGGWRELTRSELSLLRKDPSSSPTYRERTPMQRRDMQTADQSPSTTDSAGDDALRVGLRSRQGQRGNGSRPARGGRNTPPPERRAGNRKRPGSRSPRGERAGMGGDRARDPSGGRSGSAGRGAPIVKGERQTTARPSSNSRTRSGKPQHATNSQSDRSGRGNRPKR